MPFDQMPTVEDFERYRVTNPNQSQVFRARYYDWNLYATAGTTIMNFFSTAQGQGLTSALGGTVGSTKTEADTNLILPKTLSSGVMFLAESIEVTFLPGSVSTANTYTPAAISQFAVAAAATVLGMLNDVNTILQSGVLEFKVLNSPILKDTPLATFPPKTYIDHFAAVSSNSATVGEVATGQARAMGRPWYLEPPILLQPATSFEIIVRWPAAVATPSGFNGRIGVTLDGYEMRASQ